MRLIFTLIALCATLVAADDISDGIDELAKLPCALLCYNAVAIDNQCTAGDFNCVCSNKGPMAVKMGICIGKADCEVTKSVTFDSSAILQKICEEVHAKPAPSPSQIASASSKVVSIYSSIAATATSNPTPKNAAAGRVEDVKLALAGAAAVAAFVL